MAGNIKQPELTVKVIADVVQVEDGLTKAINKAVSDINKDADSKLKKVKVQFDKDDFKAELGKLSGSVKIKAFDGIGEQIGNGVADAIKKSLQNIKIGNIGIGGVSGAKGSDIGQDRSNQISAWAKQYADQETKLYGAAVDALNKVSKLSLDDFNKVVEAFENYENNLKEFTSRMPKKEKSSFETALRNEYSKSQYDSFHTVKQGLENVWGDGSISSILKQFTKHPAASSAKFAMPKNLKPLEYTPIDQSDLVVGLDQVTQKINETVKAQNDSVKIMTQNVQMESSTVSQANKTADDHAEIMKLAAEAEKAKASQSQQTGDAIRKETQAVQSSNNALKQHAQALADANEEGEQAEHIASMYGYTIAQGISANAKDVQAIAELAQKQKEAGYELQSVSVDKAFDDNGVTNLSGSLKYYNKELQTTITQSYTAVKAREQEEQGVYELNLAHERLVKTYKQEKTENAALLRDQADSMKRQFSAQVEAAHQSMDSVLTGNLKSYFGDDFIVDTEDKLKELRRAIQAAKLNLSALEQEAKSGDSFNALTNQFDKLKNVPTQLDKLKTSISRLKSDSYTSDLTGKTHDLNAEYERLVKTYNEIIALQNDVNAGNKVLTPDESRDQIKQLRNFLSDLRVLGGETGAQKAVENKLNALSPEKYNLMFRNLQSNLQKAEQKFDNLVGTTPELENRLNNVKGIVGKIASGFNGSASQMDALVRALKQVSSLNSELVGAKNSPANYIAQVYRDRDLWATQAQKLSLDAGSITQNRFTSAAVDAASDVNTALGKIGAAIKDYEAALKNGNASTDDAVKAVRKQVDEYERLNKIAKDRVALAKQEDNALRTQAVNARDLQNLEATLRNFGETNGKYRNNAGLAVMYDSIAAGIGDLRDSGKIDDVSIKQLRERLSLLDSLTTELGYKGQTYGQRVKDKVAEIKTYTLSISMFNIAGNAVRQMISNIVDLDSAMTELRKVTEETDATYEKFLTNAATRAKNLGATMSDVVVATSTFARMGYTLEQSEQLGDAALIAQNVWDNVGSVDETANAIISTMKAFGIAAEDAISIVNKLNAVSNSYAVVSGDIANAMADTGAALQAAGNTFDESISLFSATKHNWLVA